MPFFAQTTDGTAVRPSGAGDEFPMDAELECPYCEETLSYRVPHDRSSQRVSGHFVHSEALGGSGSSGCSEGGESAKHEELKRKAVEILEEKYHGDVYVEHAVGDRRADVLLEFENEFDAMGKGVAVEVQHRNSSKEYIQTTNDYIDAGYSVYWTFTDSRELYSAKNRISSHLRTDVFLGSANKADQSKILGTPIRVVDARGHELTEQLKTKALSESIQSVGCDDYLTVTEGGCCGDEDIHIHKAHDSTPEESRKFICALESVFPEHVWVDSVESRSLYDSIHLQGWDKATIQSKDDFRTNHKLLLDVGKKIVQNIRRTNHPFIIRGFEGFISGDMELEGRGTKLFCEGEHEPKLPVAFGQLNYVREELQDAVPDWCIMRLEPHPDKDETARILVERHGHPTPEEVEP